MKPDNVRCETCAWWQKSANTDPNGRCHVHAPTPHAPARMEIISPMAGWPCTAPHHWCGEWRKEWPRE